MSKLNYILDRPLPVNQDFDPLKEQGLSYIERYAGNKWTNLNASDPGVTILEQVCYALTELGYCNDFPIKDILTQPDGALMVKDQFYMPEEILTTAPVTINDYRKYIIDGLAGVTNVVIVPAACGYYKTNSYQVHLQLEKSITDTENYCTEAWYYLNKSRNIGELFELPKLLQPKSYTISGQIELEYETTLSDTIASIQYHIRQFIFPDVVTKGYAQLQEEGIPVNEIFNGPLLHNGWIPTDALGDKKSVISTLTISNSIALCKNVTSATVTSFERDSSVYSKIESTDAEILVIDIHKSVVQGTLAIYHQGKKLHFAATEDDNYMLPLPDTNILPGAAAQQQTTLPHGRYRDINDYYSIQNTFPEIYAVGADAVHHTTPLPQIARSRQLKGYLTLFDQVLANQFSQLANVGSLLSFKNPVTGIPSQREEYYAVQDSEQKANPIYPVPYLSFSATYFYQTLYNIPNIKPLLKDNGIFNFGDNTETAKQRERESWNEYKHDPYNAYSWGLMQLMEDEQTNLQRRNDILNHLLARHGESPEVITAYCNGAVYSGNKLKDSVIFKSLYLQNLQLLSYNRQKGYNYLLADKIPANIPQQIPEDFEQLILGGSYNDFIFDSEKIDAAEKLVPQDFTNYSGITLKMSLLFGFRVLYKNYIAATLSEQENPANYCIALWLILYSRGLLLLELPIVLNSIQANEASYPETVFDSDTIVMLFPDFISEFTTENFSNRLKLFTENTIPAHLNCQVFFVSADFLKSFIPVFADWHNSLRYNNDDADTSNEKALSLLALINKLKTDKND